MTIATGVGVPLRLRQINALSPAGDYLLAWDSIGGQWIARALMSGDVPDLSSTYSVVGHNHDGAYAALSHTHAASAITSGTLDAARIPDLSSTYAVVSHTHAASAITSGTLDPARIPDLSSIYAPASHTHAASAITSGTLDPARIPDLSSTYAVVSHTHAASAITSGTLDPARIPDLSSIYAPASHTHAASAITSGTLDPARIPDLSGTYAVVSHTHAGGSGDVVTTPTDSADNRIISQGEAVVPLTLRGHASQSANLQEWQSNAAVVLGSVAASGRALHIVSDAATNTMSDGLIVDHISSATPANGFGTAIRLRGQSSTTQGRDLGVVQAEWNNATDASRRSTITIGSYDGTTLRTRLILRSGTNPQIELAVTSGELFACRGESGHQLITWYAGYGGGNQYGEINVNQLSTTRVKLSAWDTCYINPQNSGAGLAVGHNTATSKLDVAGDIETGDANALYFGDPTTDGTWRITRSGTGLVIQRRESGAYNTKQTIAA